MARKTKKTETENENKLPPMLRIAAEVAESAHPGLPMDFLMWFIGWTGRLAGFIYPSYSTKEKVVTHPLTFSKLSGSHTGEIRLAEDGTLLGYFGLAPQTGPNDEPSWWTQPQNLDQAIIRIFFRDSRGQNVRFDESLGLRHGLVGKIQGQILGAFVDEFLGQRVSLTTDQAIDLRQNVESINIDGLVFSTEAGSDSISMEFGGKNYGRFEVDQLRGDLFLTYSGKDADVEIDPASAHPGVQQLLDKVAPVRQFGQGIETPAES